MAETVEDRWAIPEFGFDDLGEKERAALKAHIEMRIGQIRDGTIPFANVITFEQLKEMAGEREATVRDRPPSGG
jgi:hypothetical protein